MINISRAVFSVVIALCLSSASMSESKNFNAKLSFEGFPGTTQVLNSTFDCKGNCTIQGGGTEFKISVPDPGNRSDIVGNVEIQQQGMKHSLHNIYIRFYANRNPIRPDGICNLKYIVDNSPERTTKCYLGEGTMSIMFK